MCGNKYSVSFDLMDGGCYGNRSACFCSSIINLHTNHPSIVLIDLIPLIVFGFFYICLTRKNKKKTGVENSINKLNDRINKNADFAKRIGEGDYTSPFMSLGDDDAFREIITPYAG